MYEIKLCRNDHEERLFGMGAHGTIFIKQYAVNLDDLVQSWRPGAIVRCTEDPDDCIKIIPPSDERPLGCVAGWISEDD